MRIVVLILFAATASAAEPRYEVVNKSAPSFKVENRTACPCSLGCDCSTGKCTCGAYCSCPDCPVAPAGYGAVYARVLKGERVTFDLYERVGSWDAGTWDCWLENGQPKCQRRVTPVVPKAVTPARVYYPAYPFGPPVCLPGGA